MENKNNPTLRKLDKSKGEYCYAERKYSTDKNFSFMGTDKIESYNDVAFIFKKLQTASVENVFVLHVLSSGKPLVQHLSMGTPTAAVVYIDAVKDAVNRFNSKEVYLVHNHPSGNLTPSLQDYDLLRKFKNAIGDITKEGIIIDTISGEYSRFNIDNEFIKEQIEPQEQKENKNKITVLKFDKQLFSKNIDKKQIKNPADVASIISCQRLNTGNNLSLLIVNRMNIVTANIHLEYSEVDINKLSEDIILYTTRFSGSEAIIYGRSEEFSKEPTFVKKMEGLMKELKDKSDVHLLEFINIKSMPVIDLFDKKELEFESAQELGIL